MSSDHSKRTPIPFSAREVKSRSCMRISVRTLKNSACVGPIRYSTRDCSNCSIRQLAKTTRDWSERSITARKRVYFFFLFAQRAAAASRAISDLRLAVRLSALDLPPFNPPSRPNATAAGFLSPFVLAATIAAASWFMSRFAI